MSCYAYREDPARFVEIFNRTVEPVVGRCRLSTHLCFGNYKARAVAPRQYAPMFPAFLEPQSMRFIWKWPAASLRNWRSIREITAAGKVTCVGMIDVKSYYIETAEDVAERVRRALQFAAPGKLSFAPDCGLSQTARWAAGQKLRNMVEGVRLVRKELGLE